MSRADIPELSDILEAGADGDAGLTLLGKPATMPCCFFTYLEKKCLNSGSDWR